MEEGNQSGDLAISGGHGNAQEEEEEECD